MTKYEIVIDLKTRFQTWEDFGTSSAWWTQHVGGWKHDSCGKPLADRLTELLYDKANGLGLTEYRYNLGAEVNFHNDKCHAWRTSESFLTPNGGYDFNRDKNARYMLRRACEYGVDRVTLFCNSPPDTQTVNGKTYCDKGKSNLPPQNYAAFADYCFDIAEHFLDEGVPVVTISPVNEPQWDWDTPKQEGCRYKTEELVALYRTFFERKATRPKLKNVEISLPEGGEWGGKTTGYLDAIMKDEVCKSRVKCFDAHSYWSTTAMKKEFFRHAKEKYPTLKLKNSEWCIMETKRDFSMSAALKLADCVLEDMSVLNVIGWDFWLAVSCFDFKDGLIYVGEKAEGELVLPKMYYAYAAFTRNVKRGYVRVECKAMPYGWLRRGTADISTVAFVGEDALILICINRGKDVQLKLPHIHGAISQKIEVTDATRDLETVHEGHLHRSFALPAQSVTVVTYSLKSHRERAENASI